MPATIAAQLPGLDGVKEKSKGFTLTLRLPDKGRLPLTLP
jgi:hypothetical protein